MCYWVLALLDVIFFMHDNNVFVLYVLCVLFYHSLDNHDISTISFIVQGCYRVSSVHFQDITHPLFLWIDDYLDKIGQWVSIAGKTGSTRRGHVWLCIVSISQPWQLAYHIVPSLKNFCRAHCWMGMRVSFVLGIICATVYHDTALVLDMGKVLTISGSGGKDVYII